MKGATNKLDRKTKQHKKNPRNCCGLLREADRKDEVLRFFAGSISREAQPALSPSCCIEVCGFPGSVTEYSPCDILPELPLPARGISDHV